MAGKTGLSDVPDAAVNPTQISGEAPSYLTKAWDVIAKKIGDFVHWLVPEEEDQRPAPVSAATDPMVPENATARAAAEDSRHHTRVYPELGLYVKVGTLGRAGGGTKITEVSPTDDGGVEVGPKQSVAAAEGIAAQPLNLDRPVIDFGNPMIPLMLAFKKPGEGQKPIAELINEPIELRNLNSNVSFAMPGIEGKNFEDPGNPKLVNQESEGLAELLESNRQLHGLLQGQRIQRALAGLSIEVNVDQATDKAPSNVAAPMPNIGKGDMQVS